METILKKIYYDPTTGFGSAQDLYRKARQKSNVTLKTVKEWLSNQRVAQITKQVVKPLHFPIKGNKNHYQADLMFFKPTSVFKKHNKGYHILLNIVELTTRKGFSIPLKTKAGTTKAFAQFIKDHDVDYLTTDNGTEFTSRSFKSVMRRNNIQHTFGDAYEHDKLGKIERFNKTMRNKIGKYFLAMGTRKFMDVLDKLVENYNNSINRAVKKEPSKMTKLDEHLERAKASYKIDQVKKKYNIKVGDIVRVVETKDIFEKGTKKRYSKELFKVIADRGLSFTVKNIKTNREKRRGYKPYELLKVKEVEQEQPPEELSIQQEKRRAKQDRRLKRMGILAEETKTVRTRLRTRKETGVRRNQQTKRNAVVRRNQQTKRNAVVKEKPKYKFKRGDKLKAPASFFRFKGSELNAVRRSGIITASRSFRGTPAYYIKWIGVDHSIAYNRDDVEKDLKNNI